MIVARPEQYTRQARTGHPFLVDGPFLHWIPYMPSVGPAITKIYKDVYGFYIHEPATRMDKIWKEAWRKRSPEEWRRLGLAYGFSYVLAPGDVSVNLPEVLHGEGEALYAVDVRPEERAQ